MAHVSSPFGPWLSAPAAVPLFRLTALTFLAAGCMAAYLTQDGHWVDRSGKLIVALSLGLTYAQFRFELTYDADATNVAASVGTRSPTDWEQQVLSTRVRHERRSFSERTRHYLLTNALVGAAAGEIVSACGGVVFEMVHSWL